MSEEKELSVIDVKEEGKGNAHSVNMEVKKEYVERKRWLFLGLPFTFTKYTITEDVLTINKGLLKTSENDCYMYKVTDVELLISFWERLAGLGTIRCITGDKTHPELFIQHVCHSKEIKNFILQKSEAARIKRRTVNMQDIGGMPVPPEMMDVDEFN